MHKNLSYIDINTFKWNILQQSTRAYIKHNII